MPKKTDKRREQAKEDQRLEKAEAYRDRFEQRQSNKQEAREARDELLGKAPLGVRYSPLPSHKVGHAASTFRAQKTADQAETGSTQWRDPTRHGYDPTEQRSATATSVWPFNEHAAHRIEPHQIVGAYRLKRARLVKPEATGDDIKAGMRFSIGQKNLIPGRAKDPRAVEAQHYVKQFADTYPKRPSHFLSYQGIVEKRGKGKIDSAGDAETHARQLNPFPPGPTPYRPAKQARREKAKQSRGFSPVGPPRSGGNSRTKGQRFR